MDEEKWQSRAKYRESNLKYLKLKVSVSSMDDLRRLRQEAIDNPRSFYCDYPLDVIDEEIDRRQTEADQEAYKKMEGEAFKRMVSYDPAIEGEKTQKERQKTMATIKNKNNANKINQIAVGKVLVVLDLLEQTIREDSEIRDLSLEDPFSNASSRVFITDVLNYECKSKVSTEDGSSLNASGIQSLSSKYAAALDHKTIADSDEPLADTPTTFISVGELGALTVLKELLHVTTYTLPGNPCWDLVEAAVGMVTELLPKAIDDFNKIDTPLGPGGKPSSALHFDIKTAMNEKRSSRYAEPRAKIEKILEGISYATQAAQVSAERIRLDIERAESAGKAAKAAAKFKAGLALWHGEMMAGASAHNKTIPQRNPEFKITDELLSVWQGLVYQMNNSDGKEASNVILKGPTGVGKTTIAREFAAWIGLPLFIVETYEHRHSAAFYGYMKYDQNRTEWVDSTFAKALQAGNCVICLDELTRCEPTASNAFFPLLDWRREATIDQAGKTYKVGPNVFFFATANVGTSYTGTFRMDEALNNRFDICLEIEVPEKAVVKDMLSSFYKPKPKEVHGHTFMSDMEGFSLFGLDDEINEKIADWVDTVNKKTLSGSVDITRIISPREVEAIGKWVSIAGPIGLKWSSVSKFQKNTVQDQRSTVYSLLKHGLQYLGDDSPERLKAPKVKSEASNRLQSNLAKHRMQNLDEAFDEEVRSAWGTSNNTTYTSNNTLSNRLGL